MPRDLLKYFRVEARELVDQLEKGVLDLEKGPESRDGVVALLRVAHTLKGAARVVKQLEIAEAAHTIEDALVPVRDAGAAVTRARIEALLGLVDRMQGLLRALDPPRDAVHEAGATNGRGGPAAVIAAEPAPAAFAEARRLEDPVAPTRAAPEEARTLGEGLAEVGARLSVMEQLVESLDRAQALGGTLVDHLARTARTAHGDASAIVRGRALAEEIRDIAASAARELGAELGRARRELGEVRDDAERLRLAPVGAMFRVLERAVRDAAASADKRVAFEAHGGDIRVDPEQLGAVQAALLQGVRNAVAHGVEAPNERVARGKAAEGRVVVEAVRSGRHASFVCRDDGRGVDLDEVRRTAERKGLAVRSLGDDALLRLLLGGGISTSSAVTALSGRGVGLDIVRETAARLRGEATLETRRGQGTTLRLVVPLTASSWEVLLVEAGGQVAAIPLSAVQRTIRMHRRDVARSGDGDSLMVDGRLIPFAPLGPLLGAEETALGSAGSAVLVEGAEGGAAIGVDRLVAAETIVVMPPPDLLPPVPHLAGVSLDSSGHPRVVLDVEALVADARRAKTAVTPACKRLPILVIDDSLTTRMLEQSILESAGYRVEVATSAEEGLDKARRGSYGLFLVDVEMPGMDGFGFVEQSRADPSLRSVPAILVTSRASPEDRSRGRAVGACDYIVKSEFDQKALLERIRGLVGAPEPA